jgi:translation initiation factor IF-2
MSEQPLQSRPPIVVVLGHVDHGKTSLLDAIRKTRVASREAGGITQSIGASVVETPDNKRITFIDTPGHATFSKMRSRGAKVADIAILVVASDDGVKPQTKEAIEIIKEAQIPFLVALTKSDLNTAEPERTLGELEMEEVYLEGRGGDTPYILVSAKTGDKLPELLELVILLADVSEITADPEGALEAVVIETSKEKMGPQAAVVVRNGHIAVGDQVFSENAEGKVRAIFDADRTSVQRINPGEPGLLLGFEQLPLVGSVVTNTEVKGKDQTLGQTIAKVGEGQIAVFLKTKTAGSLEALTASLPQGAIVVGSGIGDVTESDVLFAKSANARIVTFETKVPGGVAKLAEAENVRIETFTIIYELIQRLEAILKSDELEIKGQAEILAAFPWEKKQVAGCKVTMGVINKTDTLRLMRGGMLSGKVRISSMRKGKLEIQTAKQGEEMGLIFDPQFAFEPGDLLLSVANE